MRSRNSNLYGPSVMGLAFGIVAGLAAGVLAAPMRGRDMRARLRDRVADAGGHLQSLAASGRRGWASQAKERSLVMLQQEGRRALETSTRTEAATPMMLTATIGELAYMHRKGPVAAGVRS